MKKSIIILATLTLSILNMLASIPENKEVTMKLATITKRVPKYDQKTGLYFLYDGRKNGVADSQGNIIVPIEWEFFSTNWLSEYGFIVGERNGKNTIFDVKNQRDIPYTLFDNLETSIGDVRKYDKEHCYFIVKKNGKKGIWKFGDTNLLVPCLYEDIVLPQIRSVDYWPVKDKNGLGLYGNGKEIIPCGKYSLILANQNNDFAIVSDNVSATYRSQNNISGLLGNGKFGIINLNSGHSTGLIYDGIGFYGEGCIGYNIGGFLSSGQISGGKWGYIDSQGNRLCEAIYDAITPVEDGASQVIRNGVHEFFVSPFNNSNATRIISKVDENIPKSSHLAENTFAFIIANENYLNIPHSAYSINDGEVLKKYCTLSFGIPERNVTLFADATYGNIMSMIKRLEEISDVYDGDASFLIYFSGLGYVNPETNRRVLLPIDASPNISSTMLEIDALFERLSKCKAKEYICIFDAPFNGEDRSGNLISSGRGIAIKGTIERPNNITVIMPGNEGRSNSYETLQHGLLTYCLLEIVQNNNYTSIRNAIEGLPNQVKRTSFENYNNTQTVNTYISDEK